MGENTIDNLSIQVTASAEGAAKVFDRLASSAGRVKGAASGVVGSMNNIGDSASKAADGIGKVSEAAKNMGIATRKSAEQTGESVEELKRKIDGVNKRQFSSAGAGVFAYLKKDSDVLKMKLEGAKQRIADLLNADTQDNRAIANATAEVKRLQDAFVQAKKKEDEFGQGAQDAGDKAKKGASGVSVFWNALKRVGSISFKGIKGVLYDLPKYFGGRLIGNVRQAVLGVEQFFKSITRIATYRAIRSALKLITQGFSEGIQNLYAWSAAVNGSFAASMDRLATSSLYLKNSLGAMVSPLIEAIAPAVDFIVDKFVDLLNVINQVFAVLSGKTSYTAAKKVAAQWQDASDSASGSAKKAAKEIKRTLLAFDEINKLNGDTPKNGTGSGGANAAKNAGSMMFENRDISGLVRNMVDSGDFSAVGKTIANKINKALGSINWSSIKASAVGITDSITSLINGFIQDIDPNVIGKSLAEVINTATTVIDRFWSSIEWAEAGRKTREAIVKFFSEIDVVKAADALTGKFRSIVTYIANALPQSPQEWDLIGTKISEFISQALDRIPWSTIGDIAGNLLVGGLRVMKILADDMTLTRIATGIKTAIQTACEKITAQDVASWVNSILKDVLSAVSVLLSIDLKFGDVRINPIMLVGFIALASSLIKSSFGKIFGTTTISGIGKGIALAASVALLVDVGVQIAKVFDDIKSGNKVSASDVTQIVQKAFIAAGLMAISFGKLLPGALIVGLAFTISPIAQGITELVNNTSENVKVTKDALIKIVEGAFKTAGIGLAYAGIKTGNFGLAAAGAFVFGLGFAVRPMVNEIEDIKKGIQTNGITWSTIEKMLGDAFMVLGAALMFVNPGASAVVLGLGVSLRLKVVSTFLEGVGDGARNIWDWVTGKKSWGEIFNSNSEDYTIQLTDPDAYFGKNNGSGRWTTSGVSRNQALSVDVGVNFSASDNPTYKNSTIGNYLVDTMAKVKSEVTTKVKSVAGTLTKSIGSALVPVTQDTKTNNVVYALAGSGMADKNASGLAPVTLNTTTQNRVNGIAGSIMKAVNNALSPIVSDTSTTNTVNGAAGSGIRALGNAFSVIVGDTSTTNTVNGTAGSGMVYTWEGYMPKTKDTATTNTVKAAPGDGVEYTWDGFMPVMKDTTSTVNVSAKTPWGTSGVGSVLSNVANSVLSSLGLSNLSTNVDVGLNSTWGWQGALSSLGLANLDTDVDVGLKQNGWTSVGGWITDNHYNETTINQKVGLEKNGWDWVDNWAKQFAQTPINQKVNLVLGNVDGKITGYFGGKRAKGGVFSGGKWNDIPQYAGGTAGVNHGSLFWAGENGAEIVGNAGGRTEVLNKSQIASAMFSAVQAAMAPAAANFAAAAQSLGVTETGFDLETLAEMIRQGVEQAMSRANDYDRQKVELLRSINDKDFNVDVSTASINKAQSRMNRRAGVTIAPVGT